MNREYIKISTMMENALIDINKIYDRSECEEFEDIKAYAATERLIDDIEVFIKNIKYYSKSTNEGNLKANDNDKYSINNIELSCGHSLEVYNEEFQVWEIGRVEHNSKYGGYYFYSYDGEHTPLFDGMRARIRV